MTEEPVSVVVEDTYLTATWTGLDNGDTGKPVDVRRYSKISVGCSTGTIGTSTLQGSQDGSTWGALGAGLTIAASNRVDDVPVAAAYLRPNVGAGGSGATVILKATRS